MQTDHDQKTEVRRPGRPRKHDTPKDRVKAFRQRKDREAYRIDVYVSYSANNRITSLSKIWGCSKGDAVDRLVMEAAEKYDDIIFPETE